MSVVERANNLNELIRETIEIEQKPEEDHDFFHHDDTLKNPKGTMSKHLKRKVKPYTSTRIKARNFLSNIAYAGVRDQDFIDNNFVFDVVVLLTKNLNPFSLERKTIDVKNRDIIYMFWDEFTERSFYRHICDGENFLYLNSKNVLYPKTAQMVLDYLNKDPTNIIWLRRCLQKKKKKNIVQFVCLRCFPEIYSLVDKREIHLKGEFWLSYKVWKNKKIQILRKNRSTRRDEVDIANETKKHEDEKCHQKIVEKKLKRKALAEKNDGLKQSVKEKKKQPLDKKALWEKLDNLNKNFVKIKEQKSQNKLNKKPLILIN